MTTSFNKKVSFEIRESTGSIAISIAIIFLSVLIMFLGYISENVPALVAGGIIYVFGVYFFFGITHRKVFIDPMCLFPLVSWIYLLVTPFLYCLNIYIPDVTEINKDILVESTFYSEIYVIVLSSLTMLFSNNIEAENLKDVFIEKRGKGIVIADFIAWAFTLSVLRRFLAYGNFNGTLTTEIRTQINTQISSTPFYMYGFYYFIAYSIFNVISFFNASSIVEKAEHIPSLICIVLYYSVQLAAGNRRALLYVIIVLFFYDIYRHKGKFNLRIFAAIFIVVALFLALSLHRAFGNTDNISQGLRIYSLFGEFINPFATLRYYMQNPKGPYYGMTYINTFLSMIPKQIWANKPISLANQFVQDIGTSMGYGFTPETESFLNFGIFGCVIGATLQFLICKWVCSKIDKHPFIFLALYCEIVNIFRGEFSSTFIEIVLLALFLSIFNTMSRDIQQ